MLVIPVRTKGRERGPQCVFLVLEKENLDRMRTGDPFDMHMSDYGPLVDMLRPIGELDLVIAYEDAEGVEKVKQLSARRDLAGIIRYLERNRVHQPGDAEAPKKL